MNLSTTMVVAGAIVFVIIAIIAVIISLVNNNKQFTKYLHTGISVLEYTKEGVIYHIIKLINFENINL